MRLKTRLILAATSVTFAIVLMLSLLFLSELLRQRIAQTGSSNDILARQLLMMTRQAIEVQLPAKPPVDATEDSFHAAVADALRSHQPLIDTMNSFVKYSPAVQDVTVTDAHGLTLVGTDPLMWDQQATARLSFTRLRDEWVFNQMRELLGKPRVLDVSMPLDRNAKPFLVVHIGVRSSFLKNNYTPGLVDGLLLAVFCGVITMLAAGLLASMALRPIEEISRRLEGLAGQESGPLPLPPPGILGLPSGRPDAVVRMTRTIERLGAQMQTTEAGYSDLQENLAQMLDTLRDGVLLFTGEDRAAMVSDAVANFVETDERSLVGQTLSEIFRPESVLGRTVLDAYAQGINVSGQMTRLEDGREVEISIDHIHSGRERVAKMGTLLTLRDAGSALRLERELEVSRRLAAVGRLTVGVGHEVKNPINAMVVHLELLKGKLAAAPGALNGAQRHVEILAGEMERLDRVVQTLADFTRPMELELKNLDLSGIARAVMELTGAEMAEHGVRWQSSLEPAMVRADGELLRQALLNLALNGMQAMERGGVLNVKVTREREMAILTVSDEGSGIAQELMPRIFELYFTTKPTGSGIGLAMTYRIVQMHGGSMEVKSEVGHGTVFTIRLPVIYGLTKGSPAATNRTASGRWA